MREICVFKPTFNKEEQSEIKELQAKIWDVLTKECDPDFIVGEDGGTFIRHSIKVTKNGAIQVLDTSSEPYMPILNRYLLRLILENITREHTHDPLGDSH